jgi:integrase
VAIESLPRYPTFPLCGANNQKEFKMPKHVLPITDDALAALVNGIPSLRDKALVLILAEAGLRSSEVVELNRASIAPKNHEFADGTTQIIGCGQAITSKTPGTVRDFFIGPVAMAALDAYLIAVRSDDTQAPMFLSADGKRMNPPAVRKVVQRSILRLNLAPFPTHAFRVGLAWRFSNAGMSPSLFCKLLGYSGRELGKVLARPTRDTLVAEYLRAIASFPWYQKS